MSLWNSCQRVFVQTCGSIQLELFTRNAQFCSSSISASWPSWPPVFPTGSVDKRQRCGHSASYSGHLLKLAVGLCGVYCTRAGLVAPVVGQTLFGDTGEVMVALMILRAVTVWQCDIVWHCDTVWHCVTLCDTVWHSLVRWWWHWWYWGLSHCDTVWHCMTLWHCVTLRHTLWHCVTQFG